MFFMPRARGHSTLRFDWIGFAVLSMGIGGLQLMLDRGQDQDWFTSTRDHRRGVLGGLGVYLFIVHMLTAAHPFIPPAHLPRPQLFRRTGDDVRDRHHPGVQLGADGAVAGEPGQLSRSRPPA